jgi:hypothetical protein
MKLTAARKKGREHERKDNRLFIGKALEQRKNDSSSQQRKREDVSGIDSALQTPR